MSATSHPSAAASRRSAGLIDYLRIARLDHSTKHIFIVPGIVLAYLLRGFHADDFRTALLLGFATAVCIASANYVINEWLDRDFDRHHPTKSQRTAVRNVMDGRVIALEWALLVGVGLVCASLSSKLMLLVAGVFALQGVVYNVPPLRAKDTAYLDVISESINNPIRLIIGWAIVDPTSLPPSSMILAYWFGGAFLMVAKRLSEFREIVASHGAGLLARYRASFATYSEVSLTASCIAYSLCSVSFLSIFLIKYRIEYIVAMPFLVMLFTFYFVMSTLPGSTAQKPEKLFREPRLVLLIVALIAVFFIASFVDMPILGTLAGQHYIVLE